MESSQLAEFESEISPGYHVRQKFMAFDNSGKKAVAFGHPQKGGNYHLSSPQLDKLYVVGKLCLGSLIMLFQQDWPKEKNYSFLNFLQENFRKISR